MNMNYERLQLARDILAEVIGANELTTSQFELLGWDSYRFRYYGRPTAKEARRRARAIISQHNAEMRSFATSDTAKMIADKAKNMTPAEFRESLAKAGIIDENGRLAEPYRSEDDDDE